MVVHAAYGEGDFSGLVGEYLCSAELIGPL